MPIETRVNIADAAVHLKEPFSMIELAQVDELSAAVYVCQGAIGWHRHLDEDELFLVQSGFITLESEWGAVTLKPWELAVVPKGIAHRSLSAKWSLVLLFRLRLLVDRRNGHGRIHGVPGQGNLHKTSIAEDVPETVPFYWPHPLAQVSLFRLWALRCLGISPWLEQKPGAGLFIGQRGAVLVETDEGQASPLGMSELLTLSRGTRYRITAAQPALVLRIGHEASPQG
jgi:homogentisate 1,2-dioxygenase